MVASLLGMGSRSGDFQGIYDNRMGPGLQGRACQLSADGPVGKAFALRRDPLLADAKKHTRVNCVKVQQLLFPHHTVLVDAHQWVHAAAANRQRGRRRSQR